MDRTDTCVRCNTPNVRVDSDGYCAGSTACIMESSNARLRKRVERLERLMALAREALKDDKHVTYHMDQDEAFEFRFGMTMAEAAKQTLA